MEKRQTENYMQKFEDKNKKEYDMQSLDTEKRDRQGFDIRKKITSIMESNDNI